MLRTVLLSAAVSTGLLGASSSIAKQPLAGPAAEATPQLTMQQARATARMAHATLASAMTSKVGAQAPVVIPGCERRSRTLIVCRVVVHGETQDIKDHTYVRSGKCCFRFWLRDVRTTT